MKSPNGYITKYLVQEINYHPDFQMVSSLAMNPLNPGTEDIVSDPGQTIEAVITHSVVPPSPDYSNHTVTYNPSASYTSDIYYQTSSKSMEYIENNSDTLSPELSCSFTGTSSISFALANYLSSTPPVWVTIDANSGVLNISPPDIASDTIYEFYIDSTIAGVSGPVHKLIRLTIKN